MSWDTFLFGFDVEEETRNFGTRACAVGDEVVFESTTLAVIESSNPDTSSEIPWNFSKCHQSGLAVVLDSVLIIFDDTFSRLVCNIEFGSLIDDFEWTQDGLFIFLGLRNGALFAVYPQTGILMKIPSKLDPAVLIESQNNPYYAKIKSYCTDTSIDIVVVTSRGKVIRITGDCIKAITDCCNSSEEASVKTKTALQIISNCVKISVCLSPSYSNISVKVAEDTSSCYNDIIIFSGNKIQVLLKSDDLSLHSSYPFDEVHSDEILKAYITPDQHYIICLLKNGSLLYLSMFTLECLAIVEEFNILDFMFIVSGDNRNVCKVLMLVKNAETGSYDLTQLGYPDRKAQFSLMNIPDIALPTGLDDNLYYLEFFREDGSVNKVKIKNIVESDPKFRLQRLLQRGRFKEAEEFARCFNLARTDVSKCKATKIVDEISVWYQGNLSDCDITELFKNLITTLDDIDDINFIVELCTKSVPCKLELVNKLLKYAESRLDKLRSQKNVDPNQLTEKIKHLMRLFRTFSNLERTAHNPRAWAEFTSANLFQHCQNYVKKGDIGSAIVLCDANWKEISNGLTTQSALSLLELLPQCLPNEDLLRWLNQYVPLFLSHDKDNIALLSKWISETINMIACVQKDIDACYKMVSQILQILSTVFAQSWYLAHHGLSLVYYLSDTSDTLKKLKYLKYKLNVDIPFERMPSSDSKNEKIDFLISTLECVPFDGIDVLVEHFIIPYCLEHSIRSDEILLNFITNSDVVSEMKCIKYSQFIFNKTERMDTILYILSNASVPWNETISQLELSTTESCDIYYYQNKISLIKKRALIETLLLKCGVPRYIFQNIDNEMSFQPVIQYIFTTIEPEFELEVLNDLKQLSQISCDSLTMCEIYRAYLCGSLSKGTTAKTIKLIEKELNDDELTELYEWFSEFLSQILAISMENENSQIHDYKDKDIDILLTEIQNKLPRKKLSIHLVKVIKWLWMNYNVRTEMHQLYDERNKIDLMKKCFKKLLENYEDGRLSEAVDIPSYCYKQAVELAIKLDIPFWSSCFELALEAVNIGETQIANKCLKCLIAENIDGRVPTDKICDLALRIFRSIGLHEYRDLYGPLASLMKTSSYSIIRNSNWCCVNQLEIPFILSDLLHKNNFKKPDWYSGPYYIDAISHQPDISHEDISHLIQLLSTPEHGTSTPNNLLELSECYLSKLLKKLPPSFHSIAVANKLHLAFQVRGLLVGEEAKEVKKTIIQMVSNTLLKIVNSNSLNLNSALSLLNCFSQDRALKWIDNVSFKTEAFRDHNLLHLAQVYCTLKGLHNKAKDYSKLLIISMWSRRFHKFGISFQNIFTNDAIKVSTINKLMKLPQFNSTLLESYCSSFECDYEQYLLLYLHQKLLSWRPVLASESEEEVILTNNGDDLNKTCQTIASQINGDFLISIIWDKINPYYYEVFFVLINLIKDMGSEDRIDVRGDELLLNFLKSYKRISPPSELELELVKKAGFDDDLYSSDYQSLQRISQLRLPFKRYSSHADLWKIIGPELILENYQQWFAIPAWFGLTLSSDDICVITVNSLKDNSTLKKKWDLQLKRKYLLTQIVKCVNHIKSFEAATAALYFVVNFVMPPGADKVDAAQQCLLKAIEWNEKERSEISKLGFDKAEKKYLSISVEHTLYKYNLAKPEYLTLTTQPVQLISALYHDQSIDGLSNPGINEVTQIIAKLWNDPTMLVSKKKELLYIWLSENCNQSSDDSIDKINFELESISSFDNLKRAVYMLKDEDKQIFCPPLVNLIFSQEEFSKPVQMMLRALQVLMSIVHHQELTSITGRTNEEIMKYLKNLKFIYELEQVGLFFSVIGFEKKSKTDLIMELLSNATPQKSIVAASMASSYFIRCRDIWDRILAILTSYSMINDLKKYLVELSRSDCAVSSDVLISAWKLVITTYDSKGNSSLDADKEFYNLLCHCPILDKIDLSHLIPESREKIQMYLNKLYNSC